MPESVVFTTGGIELAESIGPMWWKLTRHASEHSEHFTEHFAKRSFEQRLEELRDKAAKSDLLIDIARDGSTGADLGYCISSVDGDHRGEIDSLFVEEAARGRGVGDALVRRSIEWQRERGAEEMAVFTVYGSEDVLPFYARYGFRPKMVMLVRTD